MSREPYERKPVKHTFRWILKEPFMAAAALVLLFGVLSSWFTIETRHQHILQGLQRDARLIAQALNQQHIADFDGSIRDRQQPAYRRLQEQLAALVPLYPSIEIISLLKHDHNGTLVTLLETGVDFTEGDPVPAQTSPGVAEAMQTGAEYLIGPLKTERGRQIHVLIPVTHANTGQLLAVLKAEADAVKIRYHSRGAALIPLVTCALLMGTLLCGRFIQHFQQRENLHRVRHTQVWIVALCGLTLTLCGTWMSYTFEQQRIQRTFEQMADTESLGLSITLNILRDISLAGLSSFMAGKPDLSMEDFQEYTSHLLHIPAIDALSWSPLVPRNDREAFEANARREITPSFRIWERNDSGRIIPAQDRDLYYPLLYRAPLAGNEHVLGFDIASEPLRRIAMETTLNDGIPSASDPLVLQKGEYREYGLLLYLPIFQQNTEVLRGFITSVLPLESLLASTTGGTWNPQTPLMHLDIWQLRTGHPPLLLTSTDQALAHHDRTPDFSVNRPLLVFGKAFMVSAEPGTSFHAMHPNNMITLTLLSGLLITSALTLLVATFINRHTELEHLVQERTQALHSSNEYLYATLRSIGDGVISTDASGNVTGLNLVAQALTGWHEEQAIGHPITEIFHIVHATTRQTAFNPVERSLREGVIVGLANHTVLISRDGTEYQIADSCAPIRDKAGTVSGAVLVFRDVTEEYLARQKLQESEETYRALVSGLPDIVLRFDHEGRHVFASDNIALTGAHEPASLLGKTHMDLGLPRAWHEAVMQVFASGQANELEYSYDGALGYRQYNWRLVPEFNADGTVSSVLTISRDITEHRRAEQHYRMLFQRMLDGFALHEMLCNEQGTAIDYRFLTVNPAFEQLTGLKGMDVVGRTIREIMPEIEDIWIQCYAGVALSGEEKVFDQYSVELGRHFHVRAFNTGKGQFATLFTDITERKRHEEELHEQIRQGIEQVRQQDLIIYEQRRKEALLQLLVNLAHQWRQPLNVIGLLAQQIEDELELDHQQRLFVKKWVNGIMGQLEDLSTIIDRFTGLHDAKDIPASYALRDLCEEAKELLLGHLRGRGIEVCCTIDPGLTLRACRSDWVEIFLKLLENVANIVDERHLEGAQIMIAAESQGAETIITIEDNAGGIRAEILPRVFDPYVTTAFMSRDKGLGLYLVQRIIVDRYQGSVMAENTEFGARFILRVKDML